MNNEEGEKLWLKEGDLVKVSGPSNRDGLISGLILLIVAAKVEF
ncbi:hypothetical protein DSOL_1102 [Desulfosporosinus metallidurans]|uniref:Uncharacterized protein n=1 Tax=Desulfosporosinus metallidurans TaxID=1888891 RepID=A0A1Q8R0B4_9FIRM|nr:hypothetical protein DSOL_1102 [Desulfosporosinus metallidurans]